MAARLIVTPRRVQPSPKKWDWSFAGATLSRLLELRIEPIVDRRPIFLSETASVGSVARRMRWLDDSVDAVARLRRRGVPVVGYTWWPMFALIKWAYRQGTREPSAYVK